MASCLVDYNEDGSVAILSMVKDDNRFNLEFVRDFQRCLKEVESNPSVKVLITTGNGKYYSNGLDLEKLSQMSGEELIEFMEIDLLIHQELLTFSRPTIAAINGHAYAAGGILALAHDYLIMREERGWFCLPEVKLQRRFTSFLDLIKAKVPQPEHINVIVMGKRYTGKQAMEAGIVHAVCPGSDLLNKALELSEKLIKEKYNPESLQQLKKDLYYKVLRSLREHPPKYYDESKL